MILSNHYLVVCLNLKVSSMEYMDTCFKGIGFRYFKQNLDFNFDRQKNMIKKKDSIKDDKLSFLTIISYV